MSRTIVRIPTPLRAFTGGAAEVGVEAGTVGEALRVLEQRHRGVLDRVLDEAGEIRGFVNVYLGERNVRSLAGLDTPLPDAGVISIVPAVAGGAS